MGYIGAQPATNFETVRKQVSTTNSGTTITLDYSVSSVQDILVTVNAVVQSYDNYSVSGTTLTLGGTLNNDRVEILYVGRTFQTVTPAIGTVTNDMLSGSITASKLSSTAVDNTNTNSTLVTSQTAITSLADTDKFLVSDASDSGNLKYIENQYLGGGAMELIATASRTSGSASTVQINDVFTTDYHSYKAVVAGKTAGNGVTQFFNWSQAGGSSLSSADYYGHTDSTVGGSSVSTELFNAANAHTRFDWINLASTRTFFMIFDMFPLIASNTPVTDQGSSSVYWRGVNDKWTGSRLVRTLNGGGYFVNSTAVKGFHVGAVSSTWERYEIRVYGVKNA
jgi:hypothetical protein